MSEPPLPMGEGRCQSSEGSEEEQQSPRLVLGGERTGATMKDSEGKSERTFKERLVLKSRLAKESLSEFLGTLIMIVLGCGSVAQAVLSRGQLGNIVTINVGFAMAVVMAIYVTGGISGGHINPAVSFAMCLSGRMSWLKLPFYVAAQFLGAFTGAALLFGIYYDALMAFAEGELLITGENATAFIFATYPAGYLSPANAFVDQVASTTFLILVIFAVFDTRNLGVPRGLEPIVIGLLIVVLASSLGLNSGCAMNPARDLGPRVFTAVAGWGLEVFTAGNHFWWIPVVGPMVGAVLGVLVYQLCIAIQLPQPEAEQEGQVMTKMEKYELSVMM
ncbi:aquaporin-9 [Ornithorhynchus anatinus]|uniref:Aquaporin 9 n=1 Tax=Ornithorhynchus anatinus TaxID=9258 RepID=A0A6I8P9B8_ORNAN|nr:aquaporin-9 [Ornithorhynchus anatinus]